MYIDVIRKGEVQVIYTGAQYIFKNNFYGIIAVATRNGYASDEDMHRFTIQVGNHQCLGSCHYSDYAVVAMVKRFINKEESKYVKVTTTYDVVNIDLDKFYIDVQVKIR